MLTSHLDQVNGCLRDKTWKRSEVWNDSQLNTDQICDIQLAHAGETTSSRSLGMPMSIFLLLNPETDDNKLSLTSVRYDEAASVRH